LRGMISEVAAKISYGFVKFVIRYLCVFVRGGEAAIRLRTTDVKVDLFEDNLNARLCASC
jgi:hypothetical protein